MRAGGPAPRLGSRPGGSSPLPLLSSSSSSPSGRNPSPCRAGRSPPGSPRDATGTSTAQSCLTCLQPCPGSLRAPGVRAGLAGAPCGHGQLGGRGCVWMCAERGGCGGGSARLSRPPSLPAPAAGAGDGKHHGSGSVGSGLAFGSPGSVPGRALARFSRRKAEAGSAVQSGFRRSRRLRSNCSCCSACAAGPAQAYPGALWLMEKRGEKKKKQTKNI